MSSSVTTKAATAVEHAPLVPRTADAGPDPSVTVDEADITFGRAIVIGSIVGILVFTLAMGLVVKALAPEWPVGAVAGIAVWCGLWSGLFLGGTIAVGRWSMRQGH